ncbi:MAG: hypothetical protein ABMA01_02300 [Chthoniobacteraceae bacterium]
MKRILVILAVIAGIGAASLPVHSQAPAPAVVAPGGSALEQLKAIRDRNAKLLEQQTATLQKLEELEKTSQTVKVLGRRS